MQTAQKASFKKRLKYRFYPTKEQEEYLGKIFGCCRYVYNRLLAEHKAEYETWETDKENKQKPQISMVAFANKLPLWKRQEGTQWLTEPPAKALQQVCDHLAKAFKGAFTGKGFPQFKSKYGQQSASFSDQAYRIVDKEVTLAKFDQPLNIRWDKRKLNDKLGTATVTKTPSGKYFISFVAEVEPVKTSGTNVIGIDCGITDLVVFSDGTKVKNPRHFVKSQERLTDAQRKLNKKTKGSKNRNKQRIKVARIHEKIANQRRDYLHKLTSRLVRENQAIGIESLKVSNMVKNHRLAKHIADASWGAFRQMLEYKCHHSQRTLLIKADPYFPSTHLCSACGLKKAAKLELREREWTCQGCGLIHNRDVNSAENLKKMAQVHLDMRVPEDTAFVVKAPAYNHYVSVF